MKVWLETVAGILRRYRRRFGRFPNLLRPQTFTEKVQVAKLTWRSPLLPRLVDKIEVKSLIASKFGADLVTPLLFAGDRLPPRDQRNWPLPFVIKPSHWSGLNFFVRTQKDIDWDRIEAAIDGALGRRYGVGAGEWAYSQIRPRVLVEPFLGNDEPPGDYKLYTFGGRVEFVSLAQGRFSGLKYGVYDRDWRRVPVKVAPGPVLADVEPPRDLERMIAVAEEIGRRLPFCRVDFYEIDGKARFGEVTIYANSGLVPFDPPEFDLHFGSLWPPGRPADVW